MTFTVDDPSLDIFSHFSHSKGFKHYSVCEIRGIWGSIMQCDVWQLRSRIIGVRLPWVVRLPCYNRVETAYYNNYAYKQYNIANLMV